MTAERNLPRGWEADSPCPQRIFFILYMGTGFNRLASREISGLGELSTEWEHYRSYRTLRKTPRYDEVLQDGPLVPQTLGRKLREGT